MTISELHSRGIFPIDWPPFSPDLNPIETVWNIIKNHIQAHCPENMTYIVLRRVVKAAWDQITGDELYLLFSEMPVRCQAVIEADRI